jgi:demethylmenaquinone methyltransferase/2-methoxy-6-polyprenyl-1,4-benzoquinol methylase
MNPRPDLAPRFEPHATREMAGMFDHVTARYDLLNRLMTLGQDGAWRAAMWRAVPERARVVLDLCTGNGVSLPGLRRPGRLVLGIDVSLGMLEAAREQFGATGWAPRVTCADAFRLPLRDASVDAVTVAFGVRNLRPRATALAEIARVLRPGGTLAVLEGTAPAPGPLAPFHRFHLRHVVPLLGRLSPDPSAYRYLSESILEFGDGPEFERHLDQAGFARGRSQSFLLGASRLWTAIRRPRAGEEAAGSAVELQPASPGASDPRELPHTRASLDREWRWWAGAQVAISAALLVALMWGLAKYANTISRVHLEPWQRVLGWLLLGGGAVAFAVRTVVLALRFLAPPSRP